MSLTTQILGTIREHGLVEITIPFLFVFLIVYGILTSIDLFGDEKVDSGLSVVIALLTVFYSPPAFQNYIIDMIGSLALLLVAFFVFLFLVAASPFKEEESDIELLKKLKYAFYVLLAIIVIYMFVAYGGLGMVASSGSSGALAGTANIGGLVVLLAVFGSLGLFMYWLTGGMGGTKYVLQKEKNGEWRDEKSTTDAEKGMKWKSNNEDPEDRRVVKR